MTTAPPVRRFSSRTVFWEVASACNLQCKHCYVQESLASPTRTNAPVAATVRAILRWQVDSVILVGGEPLTEPALPSLINALSDGGVSVALTTNGTLWNPRRTRELLGAGLSCIAVSLDGGSPAVNDLVRGDGVFAAVIEFLEMIAAHGRSNLVSISHSIGRHNRADFGKLLELCKRFGVTNVVTSFIFGNSPASTQWKPDAAEAHDILEDVASCCGEYPELECSIPAMPMMVQYLNRKYRARLSSRIRSCQALDEQVLITMEGGIAPCGAAAREYQTHIDWESCPAWDELAADPRLLPFLERKRRSATMVSQTCALCYYRGACCMRCPLTSEDIQTGYRNESDCQYALRRAELAGLSLDYMPRPGIRIPTSEWVGTSVDGEPPDLGVPDTGGRKRKRDRHQDW